MITILPHEAPAQSPAPSETPAGLLRSDNLLKQCIGALPPQPAVCQTGLMDYVVHPAEPMAIRVSLNRGILTANDTATCLPRLAFRI